MANVPSSRNELHDAAGVRVREHLRACMCACVCANPVGVREREREKSAVMHTVEVLKLVILNVWVLATLKFLIGLRQTLIGIK